jgi:isoquinoline 1-oxidoreductase beta subunit
LNLAAEKFGWTEAAPKASDKSHVGRGMAVAAPFGSFVCAMVEVEVGPKAEVRLKRAVAAVDCGIAVNPNMVEAQIQGGLVFGWSAALYNELSFEHGQVQQSNFNDYPVMRIDEVPHIEVHLVPSAEAPGGIGEVGTAIASPALANAVFAATGVRIRRLPLLKALRQHGKTNA